MAKYALDTHLYVDALSNVAGSHDFLARYRALLPSLHLSSVVAQELLAGAQTVRDADRLQRHLLDIFERKRRLVTPSHESWKKCGETLAALSRRDGLELARVPRSFVNDVLIAASCREAGVTLITGNAADFSRIGSVLAFAFTPPWP